MTQTRAYAGGQRSLPLAPVELWSGCRAAEHEKGRYRGG